MRLLEHHGGEAPARRGSPRPSQLEWLDVLRLIPGVETYLWYPADWDELVEVLTGRPPREEAA